MPEAWLQYFVPVCTVGLLTRWLTEPELKPKLALPL